MASSNDLTRHLLMFLKCRICGHICSEISERPGSISEIKTSAKLVQSNLLELLAS